MHNLIVFFGAEGNLGHVLTQMEWLKTADEARAAFEDAKMRPLALRAILFGERTSHAEDDGMTDLGPKLADWKTEDSALLLAYPEQSQITHVAA
jgi:hypothetical protein